MTAEFVEQIRTFYQAHRQELYTYALSLTGNTESAEDAVHDAFGRLLRKGKTPRELRPYVFRCVRNAALDELRSSARRASNCLLYDTKETATNPDNAHLRLEIEEALRNLSGEERECIVLKIYGGLTLKEIARTLGASLNTAASWYRRGLAKLKTRFEEDQT